MQAVCGRRARIPSLGGHHDHGREMIVEKSQIDRIFDTIGGVLKTVD